MTLEYNVCPGDMDDCTKKCKYGSSIATSCTDPCACRGDYYYLDKYRGKCVYKEELPPSCIRIASPSGDGGLGDGTFCTNGYTYVSTCYSYGISEPQTTGCSNYGNAYNPETQECTQICGTAEIWDAAFQSDIDYNVAPGVSCRNWGYSAQVYNFSGILLVPGEPWVDGSNSPYANAGTCGAPSRIYVVAYGQYGATYVDYYFRSYYYTPFSFFTTLTSVQALIRTRVVDSQCSGCGGDGQPDCPNAEDTLGEERCI